MDLYALVDVERELILKVSSNKKLIEKEKIKLDYNVDLEINYFYLDKEINFNQEYYVVMGYYSEKSTFSSWTKYSEILEIFDDVEECEDFLRYIENNYENWKNNSENNFYYKEKTYNPSFFGYFQRLDSISYSPFKINNENTKTRKITF